MSTNLAETIGDSGFAGRTIEELVEGYRHNIDSIKGLSASMLKYLGNPQLGSGSFQENHDDETELIKEGHPDFLFKKKKYIKLDNFVSLQKWEGYVLKVLDDNYILVRLVNLTDPGQPDEEAEIPIQELSFEDHELIEPGAVFYWNIGYMDRTSGQRERNSVIRFRRLPRWEAEDIEKAKVEAKRIRKKLQWK